MQIVLVSEDQELEKLCGEVLNEFAGLNWRLTAAAPDDCPAAADLYIWDDHGRIAPPANLDQAWFRHLFVVHRDDLSQSRVQPDESPAAAILLKPVTRACLSAFLGLAAAAAQERAAAASTLRAERDEILQCLIQTNLQIQRYDQDRTNFLARAVHDFRTPLMTASGYCQLLVSEALGGVNDQQKEILRRMQHSIQRLNRMASAMFELSIGRQVKREPELRQGDIRACAEQALHEIAPLADGKRISVSVDLESETGLLFLDSGQIEQVLVNILENACKFTPKAGEIEIRGYPYFWERRRICGPAPVERRVHCSREPNAYRIDIRDSGPRIPRERLALIFEEYTSYAGGGDRSGGGLGLAICKMILGSHGGRVWAENSACGPRFSLVLPLRPAEAAGAADGQLRAAASAVCATRSEHKDAGFREESPNCPAAAGGARAQ
jgi:signal transduction histidine kinase